MERASVSKEYKCMRDFGTTSPQKQSPPQGPESANCSRRESSLRPHLERSLPQPPKYHTSRPQCPQLRLAREAEPAPAPRHPLHAEVALLALLCYPKGAMWAQRRSPELSTPILEACAHPAASLRSSMSHRRASRCACCKRTMIDVPLRAACITRASSSLLR